MNKCPCCSNALLKHWSQKQTYWYCTTCRQEMPNWQLTNIVNNYQQKSRDIVQQLSLQETIVPPHKRITANLMS